LAAAKSCVSILATIRLIFILTFVSGAWNPEALLSQFSLLDTPNMAFQEAVGSAILRPETAMIESAP
jgi:hypothetical protein